MVTGFLRSVANCVPERSVNPPEPREPVQCGRCDGNGMTKCESCGGDGKAVTEWQNAIGWVANQLRFAANKVMEDSTNASNQAEFEGKLGLMRELMKDRVYGGVCSECNGEKTCTCRVCGGEGFNPDI